MRWRKKQRAPKLTVEMINAALDAADKLEAATDKALIVKKQLDRSVAQAKRQSQISAHKR